MARRQGKLRWERKGYWYASLLAVIAVALYGCGGAASSRDPGDTTPPTAPSAVTASATSSTQALVTWTASTDNVGVTGYRVERCVGNACTAFAQITATTTPSFSDSGLLAGTTYGYRVRATDAAGNLSSYSNSAYVTTTGSADAAPPTAPGGLTATTASSSQINLSWTASTDNVGVTGYNLERCTGSGCTAFAGFASTTTQTTFDSTGLAAATTYGFRVRAKDAAGNLGGYSNVVYATTSTPADTTPPTAPGGLTATTASTSQINLSWSASTDNVGVTGYNLERCTGSGCTAFAGFASTTTQTTFNSTGLAAATTYGFRVRAKDAAGNLSGYSNVVYATTSTPADTTPPTAPGGLTATTASTSQIDLSWSASTDNVGVTGYNLERCTGSGCTAFAGFASTTTQTTFNSTGLAAATTYGFRVRAKDAAGNLSGYSNVVYATTSTATDTTPPTAPSSLVATATSSSQIGLVWVASTDNVGVTGYRIERCSGGGCSAFAQIGTTNGALAYSDSGLNAASSYSYRVRATDAAGNLSNYSNISSATTPGSGGSSITVSVSPRRGGLVTSQTLNLTAALTNDTTNAGVNWSVTGGGIFSSTTTTSAVFVAPSVAGVVTITATSAADPSKTASATVGVTDLAGVFTYHNDKARDGANQQEYALTTSNVTTATFGRLFSCNVDGAVYAQPLWVPRVSIGGGTHNVMVVATMRDSVYVFDADGASCVTYWSKQLLPSGESWGNSADVASADIFPDIGILGTPVIDPSTNAIYLVAKSKTSAGIYQQRLHALNLADGSERTNSPATIDNTITVSGNCEGGSTLAFNTKTQNQRPGLALVNGTVYVAWASHGDNDPYHGWLMGFQTSDLSRVSVFNSSPNQAAGQSYCRSGIWMSGGAPAADASNNLYLITGNGTFDVSSGGSNYGDSVLKFSTSSGLTVGDWFTPSNQASLDSSDLDLGSGGAVVLVDLPSGAAHQHLLIGGGKGSSLNGEIYVLNRDNMGHIVSNDTQVLQRFAVGGGIFATEAFWNNTLYVAGTSSPLRAYTLNTTTAVFNTSTVPQSSGTFNFPGATPSVSASGTSNGIVWAIDSSVFGTNDGGSALAGPAILHAYNASNVATELWNSTMGTGNTAGNAVKFTVPTVANGKVYVPSRGDDTTTNTPTARGRVDVYGLLP